MHAQSAAAPNAALVASGPLFFMDAKLRDDHRDQDVAKAETIAQALKGLGFAAFAPGVNEWAAGGAELARLQSESGAKMLFANGTPTLPDGGAIEGMVPLGGSVVRDIGGVKVGFVGVSTAGRGPSLAPLPMGEPADAPLAIKTGVEMVKKEGAQIIIALAATGRGEAKRLADAVPSLTAIVVGSPGGSDELNSPAPPPERIGDVLILETGNHLTTVGVLDLFVRGGSFAFADATGLELGQKRDELRRRIDDLRVRIAAWDQDLGAHDGGSGAGAAPAGLAKDVEARRAELKQLESDLAAMDVRPAPPAGSFFRYGVQEIRGTLGRDPGVKAAAVAYYKTINEHNRVAFADRAPPPHTADQPAYIGIDACTKCHAEPRAVWDATRHAHAYATLADQDKQFNLDCVSCHVTGYEQPGGSNVTHVDKLKDVQCEVCHGAGSKHAADPRHVKTPKPKPGGDVCLSCHHAPHVEGFDPEKKMDAILGPGHGL
jgi:hypothetical protein